MSKKIFILILTSIFILNIILFERVCADENRQIIKVGVVYLEPYVYLDKNNNLSGYYIEIFNKISKELNIDVEYVLSDTENWMDDLEEEKIDIFLGASLTEKRKEKFIYNKYSLCLETFALYTNKNIDSVNFESLNGLRFGDVSNRSNKEWIYNFFNSINIEVQKIEASEYTDLYDLMNNGKIDLLVDSAYSKNNYKKIYEFIGDYVYILGNENSKKLIEEIDKIIFSYKENNNELTKIYDKYFDTEKKEVLEKLKLLVLIIIVISIGVFTIYFVPIIRKKRIREQINKRLIENKYLLYYQPIHNPMNRNIVGFEGLLRLRDKKQNLISPAKFIPEIEKNNMLFDVTLWIIKKVVLDYNEIKNYNCMKKSKFYISLNLSIDEIQNDEFVDKAIDILNESKLGREKICLEIIERVGIKDVDKIIHNIFKLKSAGYKIAIDDFGSEYSNLDVIEKLSYDIIKVDKKFVDGLGKNLIKEETILFILRIVEEEGKSVVLEGVEEEEQDSRIRGFNSENLYVQGYFYNKPMSIENIKIL